MRPLSLDSRMLLLAFLGGGIDAGARELSALWTRMSRAGRLDQHLRNLEAAGWIGRPGAGAVDGRLFQVTAQGARLIAGGVNPEELWARSWDGKWRMVLFDVPQAQAKLRTQLRRKLRALRFGWLQNSVWLSPDPVSEFGRDLAKPQISAESLLVIEGRPVAGESDAELVMGAWDFSRLAKLHASYQKILRLRPGAGRDARLEDWSAWVTTEQRAWAEIVHHDPFLPAALLPDGYAGQTVWRARHEALTAAGHALARGVAHA
jgi:DNA-binding transcriptional regulator PaaX